MAKRADGESDAGEIEFPAATLNGARLFAALLAQFFRSHTNVSRSLFERTLATSSMAAPCSRSPGVIKAYRCFNASLC